MSRAYDGDYDGNFPNEWAFWERRARQVLHGRPGRKALAELRDALRALPEKRLVSGAIYVLASKNDQTWEHCTPEERYKHFMAWLDKRLAVAS